MSNEIIAACLENFGVSNFQGKCTFQYQDEFDFTIEVSEDNSAELSGLNFTVPRGYQVYPRLVLNGKSSGRPVVSRISL